MKSIQLKGRVLFIFKIKAKTGLHIGGIAGGLEIAGVDKTIVRDPFTDRPYIPGSSLKGKVRSLLEKYKNLSQNHHLGQGYIHSCGANYSRDEMETRGKKEYQTCDVCQVFGIPGERSFSTPTRFIVRDVPLSEESAEMLNASGRTDLPYTEVISEVGIDRIILTAHPRQMERVPAGAVFGEAEMIYSIYSGEECDPIHDIARLRILLEGLRLLEDDYLGGLGSRGSGKVELLDFKVRIRKQPLAEAKLLCEHASLSELCSGLDDLLQKVANELL